MSQTQVDSDGGSATIPRWVKIFGIITLALVLLVGVMMLAGGEHGPGRHISPASVTESSDTTGHVPSIEHGTQQP